MRADAPHPPRPGSGHVPMPHPLPPGSQAAESLLTRARCYALLGQKKTAMFDFNSVLRAEPKNALALCGRALLHLALGQQKVPGPPAPPGMGQGVRGRTSTASFLLSRSTERARPGRPECGTH